MSAQVIRIGSTFAGIGGLELGIERGLAAHGIPSATAWQCEQDPYAKRVLAKHWPDASRFDDITLMAPLIREHRKRGRGPWRDEHHNVDIICGGFPCQDISTAGAGAGLAGARSGLFFDLMRVVRLVRPAVLLLENVAAVLTRGIERVLGALSECGYDAAWSIVSAADVGAPHLRKRWFCVAWRPVSNAERVRIHGQHKPRASRAAALTFWPGAGGLANAQSERSPTQPQPQGCIGAGGRRSGDGGELGDPNGSRHQGGAGSGMSGARRAGEPVGCADQGNTQSCVGRGADGLPDRMDRGLTRWPAGRGHAQHEWEPPRVIAPRSIPHRPSRIKSLGNAVVPEVAQLVTETMVIPALHLAGVLA